MSFTKNDQAVVLNRESLQYLANCIRLVHSLPDLLNDVLPSQTTTYSSYKVTELLNTLNTDLQNYVNNALGNLSHLKKEIVSVAPTDNSADEDTIYLVQDASGGYEQYLKINGVVTSLGSTSAINNVYTKTESDGKFALISTLNSLITVVGGLNDLTTTDKTSIVNAINELKTDLTSITSHTSDTDIHITSSERTKWNEVDNKVDKTDITTSIDTSSTDSQVPSAKTVYSNVKYASGYTDIIVIDCNECIKVGYYFADRNTTNNPTSETYGILHVFGYKTDIESKNTQWIFQEFTSATGKKYMRYSLNPNSLTPTNWSTWQKVCTTTVADVEPTITTFTSTTNYKPSPIVGFKYTVSNGICYVTGGINCVSPTSSNVVVYTLPKPKLGSLCYKTFSFSNNDTNTAFIVIGAGGKLNLSKGVANVEYRCSFTYPVAEE